jgi:hypothetical protein
LVIENDYSDDSSDDSSDDDSSDNDEQHVCVWTATSDAKSKGKITGLVYSLTEAQEACITNEECVSVACKNANKCMLCSKTATKSNTNFDSYTYECTKKE